MGRTKKASTPSESAQEKRNGLETDIALEVAEEAATGRIVYPADEGELLECQDEAEVLEDSLIEYAVSAEGGLRLRAYPGQDAPVLAVLPKDIGVFAGGEPMDGWLYVHTGRLEGWMMAKHLEALPLPELIAYGAD